MLSYTRHIATLTKLSFLLTLLDDDIATLRAKGDRDCVGQEIDTGKHSLTAIVGELNLLVGRSCWCGAEVSGRCKSVAQWDRAACCRR